MKPEIKKTQGGGTTCYRPKVVTKNSKPQIIKSSGGGTTCYRPKKK